MHASSIVNLQRILKETGYSEEAIKEILKWYKGTVLEQKNKVHDS